MSSQHAEPTLTVRVPQDAKDAAQQLLKDRGLDLRAFVVANLSALPAEPDAVLKRLARTGQHPNPVAGPRAHQRCGRQDSDRCVRGCRRLLAKWSRAVRFVPPGDNRVLRRGVEPRS
jgi:hypothetical protein